MFLSEGRLMCGLRFCIFTNMMAIGIAIPANATDGIGPYTYKVESFNKKYVFIMRAKKEHGYWNQETSAKIAKIRKTYSQSGLYRNDGSTTPLWTVDWYSFETWISHDGEYLVRQGTVIREDGSDEAVSFFQRNNLIQRYEIDDLVDFPALLWPSSAGPIWVAHRSIDSTWVEGNLAILTFHGEFYLFNVGTGKIIFSFRAPRWILSLLCLALAIVSLAGWWLWSRLRAGRLNCERPGTSVTL